MDKLQKIIEKIDWEKIEKFYKTFEIYWQFRKDDGEFESRIPNIKELKKELETILNYMLEKELNFINYENWMIFYDKDDKNLEEIRIIFKLIDQLFLVKNEFYFPFDGNDFLSDEIEDEIEKDTDKEDNLEYLNKKLKIAIEKEDYETAAELRDKIKKIKKSNLK